MSDSREPVGELEAEVGTGTRVELVKGTRRGLVAGIGGIDSNVAECSVPL